MAEFRIVQFSIDSKNDFTMNANQELLEFSKRELLVIKLADDIEHEIQCAIQAKGKAVIALSGGSTPEPLFVELSKRGIDWKKVVVTLVDERWVREDHALSNAAFLKRLLLDKLESAPKFVPLYSPAEDVESSLSDVLDTYCTATQSTRDKLANFDVVILGMGSDGHTASFFPDADNIAELVDPESENDLLCCESPTTQVPRITWSVPKLLGSNMLALHITGNTKKGVYETALESGDAVELPIRSMIFQSIVPLRVYYAD